MIVVLHVFVEVVICLVVFVDVVHFFRNIISTPAILAFMQTVFRLTNALSFKY